MIYLPELDDGRKIIGRSFCSSNMWVPNQLISNQETFIRTATARTENFRTGTIKEICLVERRRNHLVVARHLFTKEEWKKRIGAWDSAVIEPQWEKVSFGGQISPRDPAQERAWEAFSTVSNGILNLACGKGKTVMALKKICQRQVPAIVIVNNKGLMDQWIERAYQFLGVKEEDIGIVQGPRAEWDKPLVLAMIHSLANHAEKGLSMENRLRFGTVIFDEVHHLSATKFSQTADLFFGNRYGLTATPVREDGLEGVYYAHIGQIFYSDLEGDLSAKIYFVGMPTRNPINEAILQDKTGEFSAPKMHIYLANNEERNRGILRNVLSALKKGRKLLVLTHSKAHPGILHEMFVDNDRMKGYTAGVVTGDTSGAERTSIIKESDVSFATFQVAKEGLDVAELDTLIFATPFRSWGAFQQGKGRVERQFRGKKDPLVLVIDDIYIGAATSMCRALKRGINQHGLSFKAIEG
ncbi:MAG: hypothetical protein CL582_21800 [Alteromonadaceae bacterium]|nr:hypothetical protein [Alteromonadaceae bacterium]|tara:strand:+ start:2656 stop:4059 length:1404 start_codon:yes stop_codon:yes gene_type:complete